MTICSSAATDPAGNRLAADASRGWDRAAILLVVAFFGWSLFGLAQSPGFDLDEAPALDVAINWKNEGFLAAPSLGPGFGHREAFFYQTPLQFIVLGSYLRVAGEGLFQARLLSLLLASVVLWLTYVTFARVSKGLGLSAALLLAFDPEFVTRARLVRYDMLPLVCVLVALWLLARLQTGRRNYLLAIGAGLAAGLAVNTHLLFLIYVPAILFWFFLPNPAVPVDWTTAMRGSVLFLGSFCLSLAPFAVYALRHLDAFRDQMLFQIVFHHAGTSETHGWLQPVFEKARPVVSLLPL